MQLNPVAKLKAARALIEDPLHWTTYTLACNLEGFVTGPRETDAICWCAIGAYFKFGNNECDNGWGYLVVTSYDLYGTDLGTVNDDPRLGHAAVLKVYDRAIKLAELASEPS